MLITIVDIINLIISNEFKVKIILLFIFSVGILGSLIDIIIDDTIIRI